MKVVIRILASAGFIALTALASGCATVVKGGTQEVIVTTDPTGASCDLKKGGTSIGTVNPTPGTVQVKKGGGDIEVTCKKQGYSETTGTIFSSLEGWTFGNILLGGVIGVVVDASTGALHQYQPEIFVKLTPDKFASEIERQDFFDTWRDQILQNSARAKIAVAKGCKEQCDEFLQRIDRETEQALAEIEANRNIRTSTTPAATPSAASETTDRAANIDRWHPSKGDRWRYRLFDRKRSMGMVSVEILESGNGNIRERITKEDSPGFAVEREVSAEFATRSFQPLVVLPGGYQFIELAAYFPPGSHLTETRLGTIPGEVTVPQAGKRSVLWQTKVVGTERVRVSAGEFQAWKVEAETTVRIHHGDIRLVCYLWYSPSAQRAVKISLSSIWPIATQSTEETLELAEFSKAQ